MSAADGGPDPVREPGPARDRDPGLQPERTRLAWRRTTLSGSVAAVLAVRTVLHGGVPAAGVLAAALCCVVWLGFLAVAHLRIRALAAGEETTGPLSPRLAAAATLCMLALAVCAVFLIL
ncbi:DUF202 domain-containing protein [Streptomyces sp. NPDC059785]|uniref:DUF202 domain-containing protein n=1 Tax=unclassified Streptomyces TaxID=2593676 RepID=UPI00364BDE85